MLAGAAVDWVLTRWSRYSSLAIQLSSVLFYFSEVFPIVRKGGLVFIKTTKMAKFISKNNLRLSVSNIDLLHAILKSNKTSVIAGAGNLYVSDILD